MSPQDSIGGGDLSALGRAGIPSSGIDAASLKTDHLDLEIGQTSTKAVIVEEMSVAEATNQGGIRRRCSNPRSRQQRQCFFMLIAGVEVLFALIIYLTGMMAEHSLDWKPLFIALFTAWTILLVLGVCVDLYPLRNVEFIKRSFCHLGCCILMRYIIVSRTQSTADALPRDLPLIIDCGLGVSIGIQMLPLNIRRDLWNGLNELVGSFCGGVQVRFQSGSSAPGRPRISSDDQ